jgi:hypothetical protein
MRRGDHGQQVRPVVVVDFEFFNVVKKSPRIAFQSASVFSMPL